MAGPPGYPTASRRCLARLALVAWVLFWIAVGGGTAVQVANLARLSDTLTESAQALDAAGRALQAVGRAPVIGDAPERLGNEVREAAREIEASGASSRRTIRRLSVLLGLSVVLLPISTVAGWYLPPRISLARQRREIERALAGGQGGRSLERFLAHRAVQNLPFEALRRLSPDPWGDLEHGTYRRLANAELARLGLAARPEKPATAGTPPAPGSQEGPTRP